MAHKVTFSLPERELGRADIVVLVKHGGNKVLGKLLVSRGGIEWRPKNSRRGNKRNWVNFDVMMQS
jgi:hypothetical protein